MPSEPGGLPPRTEAPTPPPVTEASPLQSLDRVSSLFERTFAPEPPPPVRSAAATPVVPTPVVPSPVVEGAVVPSAAVVPVAGETAESSASSTSERNSDLYSDLFAGPRPRISSAESPLQSALKKELAREVSAPRAPATLAESGLSLGQLDEAVLKQLYLHGTLLGGEVAKNTCLPFPIIEEALRDLKDQRCIEVAAGDVLGRVSYRFALTDLGRVRAREAFEVCRYAGPAPVPLEQYVAQCRIQSVCGTECSPRSLATVFEEIVMPPRLMDDIGPAIVTGQSIFLFGLPGNGKTLIAKAIARYLNLYGGEIYVPYAIQLDSSVITVFDPAVHKEADAPAKPPQSSPSTPGASGVGHAMLQESSIDLRWRKVRRPVVITGGELTLDQLELQYHQQGNYYTAPVHLKANGGVFFVDDFGRQLARPQELLNRWIVPLEEKLDYLTLMTGKKLAVPFEQLVIFSTNLEPRDLVDDAFLRRIRHRIRIEAPSRDLFLEIFHKECERWRTPLDPELVEILFREFYGPKRPCRASDPRDLLQICHAICRFHDTRFELDEALLRDAARRFFLL